MAFSKFQVPRIAINAEHQRLMWLNFSPALIVGLILIYGFVTLSGYDTTAGPDAIPDFYEHMQVIGNIGYGLSITALLVILGNSVKADIKSHFWDQLRMSSLSAWQMTWTRIFTAPVLAWISIVISSTMAVLGKVLGYSDSGFFSPVTTWLMYLIFAILIANIALIQYLQFGRSQQEWQGTVLQSVLLYFALTFYLAALPGDLHSEIGSPLTIFRHHDSGDGLLGFLLIGLVYSFVGTWQSMSYKLHLKSSHLYWLIATLILPVVLTIYHRFWEPTPLIIIYYMTVIYGVASMMSLTIQDNRLSTIKSGFEHLAQFNVVKAFKILPAWVVFLPLCILLTPFYLIYLSEESQHYMYALFILVVFAGFILFTIQMTRRFNAITLALVVFIIVRTTLLAF